MYLVPANAKKSTLILGFMKLIDLIIVSVGMVISIFLLAVFDTDSVLTTVIICLPGVIGGLLVLPIPNYHNTRVAIQSIFRYFNERRNYIWRGWCIYDEYKENK